MAIYVPVEKDPKKVKNIDKRLIKRSSKAATGRLTEPYTMAFYGIIVDDGYLDENDPLLKTANTRLALQRLVEEGLVKKVEQ